MEATRRKKWEDRGRTGSQGSKKKNKQKTKTKHWGEINGFVHGWEEKGKKKEGKGGGGRRRESR
jgi:hypothetical protein